jgi:hypothetical protein
VSKTRPAGHNGDGEKRVTFGDESVIMPMKSGRKRRAAESTTFVLWDVTAGGQLVQIFRDDIRHTSN